jgi:hypothetical protein
MVKRMPTAKTGYDGSSEEALIARKERARQKYKAGKYKKGCGAPSMSDLQREARAMDQLTGGSLNPQWVEWLMGWPLGWTDLQPLETDKFRNAWLSPGQSLVEAIRNEFL